MQENRSQAPQGALRQADGSVEWRIWAPLSTAASLVMPGSEGGEKHAMTPEGNGYFVYRRAHVADGSRYVFSLADGNEYPDPASRWQPEGVHRASAVFSPASYAWTDQQWQGVAREDLVIYELHVGAFTPQGTFDAALARLPELASLGITAIELMPVAQFPGSRNWGYDGVYPYAVQNSYGGPEALQRFVDAAHGNGLAVILDVVYNHLGPEGNYFAKFGPYFTDRYHTPWGMAINYDGPDSDAVRQFVIDNACAWVRDFHVDGLRLDAVQTIYDSGPLHILAEIQSAVQREAARQGRVVHVIAETNQNDVRLIHPEDRGGYGLDGLWSDDFHHSVHALLTGERDGYYLDFGEAAQVTKTFNDVFVYDGRYSPFHRRRHGSRVGTIDRTKFVICVQNHDQVGNRARGERLGTLVPPSSQRLACGLLLLSPCVPLLFMGEEYGEQRPFPFFCSFDDPVVVEGVRRGRREEFAALAFRWGAEIPDAQDAKTFAAAKLDWEWPEGSASAKRRQLYRDLLSARRRWPALRDRQHTTAELLGGSGSNDSAILILRRGEGEPIVAVANLTPNTLSLDALELGGKRIVLSTEDVCYGGSRLLGELPEEILPHELLIYDDNGGVS